MKATPDTWTVQVDGDETTFTRNDVALYFGTNHGTSGMRSFGPVDGDWRMIERLAADARAYFDGLTSSEKVERFT